MTTDGRTKRITNQTSTLSAQILLLSLTNKIQGVAEKWFFLVMNATKADLIEIVNDKYSINGEMNHC